jgi:hypothetical protein
MTNQVIPDAAVEAAARCMALATIHGRFWSSYEWDSGVMSDRHKEPFRTAARAALEAAAPHLIQIAKRDAWDEGWQKAHATEDPAMAGIFFNPYR